MPLSGLNLPNMKTAVAMNKATLDSLVNAYQAAPSGELASVLAAAYIELGEADEAVPYLEPCLEAC